jgi:Predicted periplasmic solute-binding protein
MSALPPPNLSFGLSPCPNDTYIFHAMLHGLVPVPAPLTPHMADVEELNNLARQKALDVTKMSLGATTEIMQDYALMSSGAALGWGCGPLVVARKNLKPEDWRNATVAVPGLLTTGNLLLTLHGGFQGPRKEMLFSDVMSAVSNGEADLGLIIHEGRFTYARQGLVKLLDLGQWWEAEFFSAAAAGGHCRAARPVHTPWPGACRIPLLPAWLTPTRTPMIRASLSARTRRKWKKASPAPTSRPL